MDETIQIPGYTVEKKIGSGAMATVYLAIQNTLERRVALKIMSSSLQEDDTFQKRFLKEGKIIAQLTHPNIVTIYDIGVVDSHNYMAMEYVDGGMTLSDKIIPHYGMPPEQAIRVLIQVASALGYAHKRNFVHRDVKPANILFRQDGTAVLSDFGIAKALGDSTAMTRQGWAVGTPSYMSPEQALGKTIDARCDLYCLGVVLYEMLTGNKPYQANDSFAVALKHVNDPLPTLPPPLSRFQTLIDRMMAKKPEERFDSAEDLIAAARQIQPLHERAGLNGTATLPPHTQTVSSAGPTTGTSTAQQGISSSDGTVSLEQELPRRWSRRLVGGLLTVLSVLVLSGIVWFNPALLEQWSLIGTGTGFCKRGAPLSAQQQQQIDGLWMAIEINLDPDIERLVSPPVSNAAYGLQEVLKIDPCNERARQQLNELPARVLAQIQARRAEGQTAAALALARAGLGFFPDDTELQRMQQELE